MIRRPPRSTQSRSSAASDVYKRQLLRGASHEPKDVFSRALFPNARGALVSEGVLHVGAMGVALCRAGGNPSWSQYWVRAFVDKTQGSRDAAPVLVRGAATGILTT